MKYFIFIFSFNSLFAFTTNDVGRTITALLDVDPRGLVTGESYQISEILTDRHARLSNGNTINIVHDGLQWEFTTPPDDDDDDGNTTPVTPSNPWGFEGSFTDTLTGYHLIEGSDYWGGACDYVFGITYLFEYRFLPTGGFCTITPDSFFIEDYYFQTDPIRTDPNMPFTWLVQFQRSKIGLYDQNNQLINPLEPTNGVGNQKFRVPIYGIDKKLSFGGTVNYSFNMIVGIKGTYVVVDHIGNKTGQQVPYAGKYDHLVTYNVSENISISYSE
jgi:hypothetical protein